MRILFCFALFSTLYCTAQDAPRSTLNAVDSQKKIIFRHKKLAAGITHGSIMISTLAILNKYWYANQPRQKLGSFNDSKEWLQMDKIGHTFSTYLEARLSKNVWEWGGLPHKKSVLLGTTMALLYQTGFEIMDGTVSTYGFSWSDMAANTLGATLYASQELLWKEQRIQPKLSYTGQHYEASLQPRVKGLYGSKGTERFLKDYNGQTHWWSINLKSFAKKSNIPSWLNIAVGMGADGMLGGFDNSWKDVNNNTITRFDIARQRQFYLAPDIDFTKIRTNKKGLKILFYVLNLVKFPAPGLELSGGKLQLKGIAY
jgi:hypothetical protein